MLLLHIILELHVVVYLLPHEDPVQPPLVHPAIHHNISQISAALLNIAEGGIFHIVKDYL